MEAHQITIGRKTSAVIVVDPLEDFGSPNSIFARCYGAEDVEPVVKAIESLKQSIEKIRGRAHLILCRSSYSYDQFGEENLEELCTTEQGRRSLIPQEWFDEEFVKTDNSIFVADIDMEERLQTLEHLVLCGITTTSCVKKSLLDTRTRMEDLKVIVPRKHVASRASRNETEKEMLSTWSRFDEQKIIVVPALEDICFV